MTNLHEEKYLCNNQELLDIFVNYYLFYKSVPKNCHRTRLPIDIIIFDDPSRSYETFRDQQSYSYLAKFQNKSEYNESDLQMIEKLLTNIGYDANFVMQVNNIVYSADSLEELMSRLEDFAALNNLKVNKEDRKNNQEVLDMVVDHAIKQGCSTYDMDEDRICLKTSDGRYSPIGFILSKEGQYDASLEGANYLRIKTLLKKFGYNGQFLSRVDDIITSSDYSSSWLPELSEFVEKHDLKINQKGK